MATKFIYAQGDDKKTPVDPKTVPNGTMLVRVTERGLEFPYCNTEGTEPALPPPAPAPAG